MVIEQRVICLSHQPVLVVQLFYRVVHLDTRDEFEAQVILCAVRLEDHDDSTECEACVWTYVQTYV